MTHLHQVNSKRIWISIDLGGTNLRGGLVDHNGKIRNRLEVPTSEVTSATNVVRQIGAFCTTLNEKANLKGLQVAGIGVAVPGFLNARTGVVYSSPNLPGLDHLSLASKLKNALGRPVTIENDANCASIGEFWKGAGKGRKDLVVLTLGTGVGGGIIADGKLVRGFHGCGGEPGHILIDPKGPRCGCGARGCLEAMVSGSALFRRTGKTAEQLAMTARLGKQNSRKTLDEMGRNLGIAIGSLCFLFDPEVVILAGKLSKALPLYRKALLKGMKERLGKHPASRTKVIRATCGDNAGLLGAAKVAMAASEKGEVI